MKCKLLFVFNILLLIPALTLSAQNKKTEEQKRQDLERFRSQRVAYFTKEIGLTEDEAKVFWPICNELEEKIFEINRSTRQGLKKIRDFQKSGKQVSDADYDQVINLILDSKEKEAAVEKEYVKKLRKVLSPEKVLRYQRAEYKFAKEAFLPSFPPEKK